MLKITFTKSAELPGMVSATMVIPMRGISFKVAAICLLLWAALDLCSPQNCLAERIPLPPAAQQADLGSNHDGQAPLSDHQDGDCFCCCMHVAISPQFQVPELTPFSFHAIPVYLSQSDGSGQAGECVVSSPVRNARRELKWHGVAAWGFREEPGQRVVMLFEH